MWKICTKCGKHKALWAFSKHHGCKFNVRGDCKECCQSRCKKYYQDNIEERREKQSIYNTENIETIRENMQKYREKNPEAVKRSEKKRYWKDRNKRRASSKKHRQDNLEEYKKREREYSHGPSSFKTYGYRLTIEESARLAKDNISLETKCKYCRKYFVPTNLQVTHRVRALNNLDNGAENNIYCSAECKVACPTFKTYSLVPGKVYREATPEEMRQIVFKRCNYICEKCGKAKATICHHIKPVAYDTMEQFDPDNGMGVCKDCHIKIHQQPGCTNNELAKYSVNNCKI